MMVRMRGGWTGSRVDYLLIVVCMLCLISLGHGVPVERVLSESSDVRGSAPLGGIPRACSDAATRRLPFCDPSLPLDTRVKDLVGRLTLEEKPQLLTARRSPLGNISRLGLPEYDWGGNCIHGVQSRCGGADFSVCPTSFPCPNALGASFNRSVWRGMGSVIGRELRALWLAGVGENHDSGLPHIGLDCWSPNVGIVRDPRWGRNMETPGEDPYLVGEFGAEYSRGIQNGEDSRFIQAVPTLKHFDANSLEGNWGPGKNISRHNFNAIVSSFDLETTYLPAFRRSVMKGGALGVMCSYNAVNGIPSCANKFLLQKKLRGEWKFEGYVTSDSGAIQDIYDAHHYTETMAAAVADSIAAGCDVDSGGWPSGHPWGTGSPYLECAAADVRNKTLKEADLDAAVYNALKIRFMLGLFDPIDDQPFWHIPLSEVGKSSHIMESEEASAQGLVLLKNERGVLPLSTGIKLAVIGPLSQTRGGLLGNYLGQICPGNNTADFSCVENVAEALEKINVGGITTSALGLSTVTSTNTSGFADALRLSKEADAVVLVIGIDTTVEREGQDRTEINLPGAQAELVDAVSKVAKKLVLVLLNGGVVALEDVAPKAGAVVEAFYPGVYGSSAIARQLFGSSNRWGKLPVTVYDADFVKRFDMLNFDMSKHPGRTYRYYTEKPVYPFGWGLSYTSFSVCGLSKGANPPCTSRKLSSSIKGSDIVVKVQLKNTGKFAGDEVLMSFFEPLDIPARYEASHVLRQMFDFTRVHLQPESSVDIDVLVTADDLASADDEGTPRVFEGRYTIIVSNGVDADVKLLLTVSADGTMSLLE